MKPETPRSLDQVLQRLLMARLFLPVVVSMLVVLALGGVLVWQSLTERQEILARALAGQVNDYLVTSEQVLTAAASIANRGDPSSSQASLDRLRQAYPQFDIFYLVDSTGKLLQMSPADKRYLARDMSDQAFFQIARQEGKVAYTQPFTSPKTGRLAVDLALKGTDGSLMVGELSLNALQAAVNNRLKSGGQPASALITSNDGIPLAYSDPQFAGVQNFTRGVTILPGNATHQIFINPRSQQPILLAGITTVEQTGWIVSVETSVLASLSIFVIGGAASFILVVALTVFLIVGFGKRLRKSVVHPLAVLNERTTQLAQGDFSRWVSFETVSNSSLEIAELANNFQKMQVAIQQRQALLQTSELRFREMTELLPDMVFELDLQRSIKYANRATSLALGYTYPEFEQGINFDQLLTQDEVQNLEQACTLTAEGYLPQPVVYRFKRKDGSTFPGEFALSAVRDRDGFVTGFRGVARDITERLSFEEALRRSYQLFTEGPVVVFRVQADGSSPVEYVTPNVAQFGYKPHDFTSREEFFSQIIHPNDAERVSSEAQRQLDAGALYYEQEYRVVCANGETRWVYDFTSVNRDSAGKPTHIDWYMLDITERKQAEVRIKTQLQRLAALQLIDASITANADIRFTLQILVAQLLNLLKVDAAIILRYNPRTQRLEYAAGDGFRIEVPTSISLKLGESYAGRAAQVRERVQLSAAPEELAKEFKTPSLGKEEFVTYYGLPLIAKSEVKGVLEVFHRSHLDPDQEWMDFLENLAGQAAIAISSADLLENLHRSYAELKRANYATIEGFSRAMEIRDRETEGHSQRVSDLTARLAARVGVAEADLEFIRIGALLHDFGKVAVPDDILLKEGKLTEEEWQVMRRHPVDADRIFSGIDYLQPAMDIPKFHHEKWDGSGYPYGLKGKQIPLAARIFAVVDVWDALSYHRSYRPAWPQEKVRRYLREQAGKHFDPALVEPFLEILQRESEFLVLPEHRSEIA